MSIATAASLAVCSFAAACTTEVDPAATFVINCPPAGDPESTDPYSDFRLVTAMMEQRCGTLDCHGDARRPLVVYGRIGLRGPPGEDEIDDPEYFSGGQTATTDAEIELNYRSMCGLEPEKLKKVIDGDLEPDDLTLVRKPKLAEKHKGGSIWESGKPGDRCLSEWSLGDWEPGTFNGKPCTDQLSQ